MPTETFETWAARRHECEWRLGYKPSADEHAAFEAKLADDWRRILEGEQRERALQLGRRREYFLAKFPRRAARAALDAAAADPTILQVAQHRGLGGGIVVLSGPVGVGKTVAACWLALQREGLAAFVPVAELASTSRYDEEACARWRTGHALIIDDLGAEYLDAKGSLVADIDAIVDRFYSSCGWLCITTNLTPADFHLRYGARLVDRIREAGHWISIAGPSRRAPRSETR